MLPMTVPQPVMSLAIMAKAREATANFSKALNRFTKEDPTFKASTLPSHFPESLSLSHPWTLKAEHQEVQVSGKS